MRTVSNVFEQMYEITTLNNIFRQSAYKGHGYKAKPFIFINRVQDETVPTQYSLEILL